MRWSAPSCVGSGPSANARHVAESAAVQQSPRGPPPRQRTGSTAGSTAAATPGPQPKRSHKPAADEPASRRAPSVQTRDQLRSTILARLRLLYRPVERRRSSTSKCRRLKAVAPEPDPQERRRDVGRASVLARVRTFARNRGLLCRWPAGTVARPGPRGASA